MNENILLISYYFAPDNRVGAKRFSYLSKYLSREGIKPHILTIKEKYIRSDESLISMGIIHRTSLFPPFPFSKIQKLNRSFELLFGQIDQHIGWFLPGIIRGYNIIRRHNVKTVVVTGPPFSSFLIPYIISFFLKFKFFVDYRDPWILYLNSYSNLRKKVNWFFEKRILQRADCLIFNTKNAMEGYFALNLNFSIKEKSVVLPNIYIDQGSIQPKYLEKNRKTIVYTGNFYGDRSITYLFEPISKLISEGKLNFECFSIHIFGTIPNTEWNKIKLYNFPLNLIVEHERINYNELLQYLKGADVLYLSQGVEHEYSIPYKLIDYLSVRKPVLAVTSKHSATYNIINEIDCGEAADINKDDSIYQALKNILFEETRYSFAGRAKYSFENVFNKYLKIIDKI